MRRPARLILATAALGLAAAPAADAASTLTINGAGFGHGIGMSQYGAAGMAKQGWDAPKILGHFFQGTQIGQAPDDTVVRVLLQTSSNPRFTGATNAGKRKLDPAKTYGAIAAGDKVRLTSATGATIATVAAPLTVTNSADQPIKLLGTAGNGVPDGTYRGWFEFRGGSGGTLAINALGLEQYVAGVIPNEAIPSWPAAALEAQAIAARGYAITTGRGGSEGWDMYPDTRSQMYRGVVGEHPATNKATNATTGQVVTYEGDPITAYFFSTSGGRTENVENVWPGATPQPYLTSVEDPYDDISPYHRWGPIRMSMATASAKLGSRVKGTLQRIVVNQRGSSPRIVKATLIGTGGRTTVTGADLRTAFALRDSWMTFNSATADVEVPAAEARKKATARAASANPDIDAPRVVGSAFPSPPGTLVQLQERRDGRWTRVASTRLGSTQRYKIALPGEGRYRVKVGDAPGPIVTL